MARIPKLDPQGRFLAPDVNAQLDARTKATLRADLPGLAKELKIGGSGVEQVAGTVTLAPGDGAFRQVYATAAATVQTEALSVGEVAIFRYLGGAWQVRVMNSDGSVRDPLWRAPGAPDLRAVLTPTGPTWTEDSATGKLSWTTPTQSGITYTPASGTVYDGAQATVTATATDPAKYRLAGATSWTRTAPRDPATVTLVTSFSDDFQRADGAVYGTTAPTGQKWGGNQYEGMLKSGALAPPISAGPVGVAVGGVAREVTCTFAFDAAGVAVMLWPWSTSIGAGGGAPTPRVYISQTGQVSLNNLASVTVNAAGGTTSSTPVGYLALATGVAHTARATWNGTVVAVYVNGTKIIEGTPSADMSTAGFLDVGASDRSGMARVDDIVVKVAA